VTPRPLRLAVYNDNAHMEHDGAIYADRALVIFIAGVAAGLDRLVLAGQLKSSLPGAHYRVPPEIEFAPLPSYPSLTHPLAASVAMTRSLRRLWRVLDDVDAVWLLGPHPMCVALAALAVVRRRGVALGVRQDFPAYLRSRHPRRRWVHVIGDLLEGMNRLMARWAPTVVVGPDLARKYRHARRLLPIYVSLVREADVIEPPRRPWGGVVLSVGRLETEKNPLLLADVLRRLVDGGGDWRLVVCGEGPLEGALRERLEELGVADRAELRGYTPIDGGLVDLYRSSDALLHASWTEGMPQVLLEAFAAGLPMVATAVGGVPEAVGDAALLVEPGDADAAAAALQRLAADAELRGRLAGAGNRRVRGLTLEAESGRVADFLTGSLRRRPTGSRQSSAKK
jgi:glycosyltransferase involved in cell wall biosynthesis